METALYFVMTFLSLLLVAVTLLEGNSHSLGGGGGGASVSFYPPRRGFDKTVFNTTIILGVIWAVLAAVSSVIQ